VAKQLLYRDEAQPHVKGFPGAKYKKFKSQPEAEVWYRSNLPHRTVDRRTTAATPTATLPNIIYTSSSSSGATYTPSKPSGLTSKPSPVTTPKSPAPQPISQTVTTPALKAPVHTPKIAAPKNTTVDIVYSDGACRANGTPNAVGGIGVWWGPDDPRYYDSSLHLCSDEADWVCQSGICLRDAPVCKQITGQS